jgi:hypothetical protein
MLTRVCLSIALLVALPACSQVVPAATGGTPAVDNETPMQTPPPVSGEPYPTLTGSETRSNYLRGGLSFETAYDDNEVPYETTHPIGDVMYSIRPTIAIDLTTPRFHQTLTYNPGFTFYQRTSGYNESDQNASLNIQSRLSQHTAFNLRESFQKSSNVFNQDNPYSGSTNSGSPQSPTAGAIAPFADRLNNAASGEISYQLSANRMLGAGGTSTKLTYPNLSEVPGLCDSNSRGGSAFYNLRLSASQYAGGTYQYSQYVSCPTNTRSDTQTHAFNFYYTLYLMHALSMSFSGGPQHYSVAQIPFPSSSSWTPSITGSMGWQGSRTSLTASYSRTVNGGGGLLGAFHSNTANAQARWQVTRPWTVETTANYEIHKNVDSLLASSSPGGHTISGTFAVERTLSERLIAKFGYQRQHQSYSSIPAIAVLPDSNREYVSVSYQFERPLGR